MVPTTPTSAPPPRSKQGGIRASEAAPSPLSLLDLVRVVGRRWYLIVAIVVVTSGGAVFLHLMFPPWVQASVYLKFGQDWGRAVREERQSLDEAFGTNRALLAEQLMREGNIGPKPKPSPADDDETPSRAAVGPPLVVWDLSTANIDRCELPPNDLLRMVIIGNGRTPELAVAFLEHVSDRIVEEHLKVAERYREKWKRRRDVAAKELDRLETVRKNISSIEATEEREKALKSAALDLLKEVATIRGDEQQEAGDELKLQSTSMTSRTGTPKVLGPVGARALPLVLVIGTLSGLIGGCVVALIPDILRNRKLTAGTPRTENEDERMKEAEGRAAPKQGEFRAKKE